MTKPNRNTSSFYALLLILILFITLSFLNNRKINIWYLIIAVYCIVTACIICVLVVSFYISRKNIKLTNLLNKDCDPQASIDAFNKKLKRTSERMRQYVLLQLGVSHIGLGDLLMARQALNMAFSCGFSSTRQGAQNQLQYHQLMCSLFIELHDIENAEKSFADMKAATQNSTLNAAIQNRCLGWCTTQQFRINMEKGIYDCAEQFFRNAFDVASFPLQRVETQFTLGRIYLHFGRTEEAEAAFDYVIANGNKLSDVAEAQRLLAQIGEG